MARMTSLQDQRQALSDRVRSAGDPTDVESGTDDAQNAATDDGSRRRCLEQLHCRKAQDADRDGCVRKGTCASRLRKIMMYDRCAGSVLSPSLLHRHSHSSRTCHLVVERERSGDNQAHGGGIHPRQRASVDGLLASACIRARALSFTRVTRGRQRAPRECIPICGTPPRTEGRRISAGHLQRCPQTQHAGST